MGTRIRRFLWPHRTSFLPHLLWFWEEYISWTRRRNSSHSPPAGINVESSDCWQIPSLEILSESPNACLVPEFIFSIECHKSWLNAKNHSIALNMKFLFNVHIRIGIRSMGRENEANNAAEYECLCVQNHSDLISLPGPNVLNQNGLQLCLLTLFAPQFRLLYCQIALLLQFVCWIKHPLMPMPGINCQIIDEWHTCENTMCWVKTVRKCWAWIVEMCPFLTWKTWCDV